MKTCQKRYAVDAPMAGPLLMLSAAMLFTLLNLMVKTIGPEYSIWHIGFFRFFGGLVCLMALYGRQGILFSGHNTPLLIIRGCTGSVAFISVIMAVRLLPVSTALVIFYCFPAFAAIFAFIIYKERIGVGEISCILAVLFGVAVLFDFHLAGGLLGQSMAIIGGVFAGLTVTLIRSLREKNGSVIIYLYFCLMGSLVTLPMFLIHPILPDTTYDWIMVLGIIFASLIAQIVMNQGFYYCRGWEGGVFMSSEVIFTAIVGILFLDDPVTWRFWTGGILILGSSLVLNRLKAKTTGLENTAAT